MGASWSDLDKATQERLLLENPEFAAEFEPREKAAPKVGGKRRQEPVEVDPEVARILAQVEAVKQNTLDLRAQAGLVRAQVQLENSYAMLARARQASKGGRHHRGRGRHRFGLIQTTLLFFGALYLILLLAGGG